MSSSKSTTMMMMKKKSPSPRTKKLHRAESDESSLASNASVQDLISSIHSESSRRRTRVRRIRSFLTANGGDTSSRNSSFDSNASERSTGGGGIMTVRTQEESLKGGKITELRKLRRRMKIRFRHGVAFDVSAEDKSSASTSTAEMSVVSFDSVNIREYSLIPGDNPSVSEGTPLSLGWEHCERYKSALDPYESFRDGRRRTTAQMKIPSKIRKSMLLHHGHSPREVEEAAREASKSRMQREYTVRVVAKSLPRTGGTPNKVSLFGNLFGNNQIDNDTEESSRTKIKLMG